MKIALLSHAQRLTEISMDKHDKSTYAKPTLSQYGRVTQFTQGATGPLGDQGGAVGKRPA